VSIVDKWVKKTVLEDALGYKRSLFAWCRKKKIESHRIISFMLTNKRVGVFYTDKLTLND